MKLDLGCGASKHPDFFGIDRRPQDGVDLVWDVNNGIPLPDDSVEWVMASRSLPYIQNLYTVLSEIYRISIHKAVICILAPYAHSFKTATNPLLRHRFDEHTPRYLTKEFYQPPHGPECPVVSHYLDLEEVPFDFRLLRMEYFYNEAFRSPIYEADEVQELQRLQTNVVDEIMYHLVVVKESIAVAELDHMSRQAHPEPHCVQALRKNDASASQPESSEPQTSKQAAAEPAVPPKRMSAPRRYRKKAPRLSRHPKKRTRFLR